MVSDENEDQNESWSESRGESVNMACDGPAMVRVEMASGPGLAR